MDLRQLKLFQSIAKNSSIKLASEELGISPAAASKSFSELEADLDLKLAIRTTRAFSLTEAGKHLLQKSGEVLEQMEGLELELRSFSGAISGTLNISAPMSFGLCFLGPITETFMCHYPKVKINIIFDDAPTDLIKQGLDLAVRIQPKMPDSDLICRKFGEFDHYIVAAKNYFSNHCRVKTLSDLQSHNIFAYKYSKGLKKWRLKKGSNIQEVKVSPKLITNNSLFIKNLVKNSKGLALMPSFLVKHEIQQNAMQRVLPSYTGHTTNGWLVLPQKSGKRKITDAFVDFFLKKAGEKIT